MRRFWETEGQPSANSDTEQGAPRIRITYEVITEESARDGDAADRGWENEEGEPMLDPDDEDTSPVENAVKFLRDNGATEPSSSKFHRGVWYSQVDPEIDYRSGESTYRSFHLVDFDEDEEQEIFNEMNDSSARNRAKRNWTRR